MNPIAQAGILFALPVAYTAGAADAIPTAAVKAFDTYTALPGKLVPILQNAKDQASADATAPALTKALSDIYEARELIHKLPRLTARQNQAVRLKYAQRMREEWGRMYEEITRVRNARCYQSADFAKAFRLMCMMIEK